MARIIPVLMLMGGIIPSSIRVLPRCGPAHSAEACKFYGKTEDMSELVFLKLGGSLITDKTRPYTARLDKLTDLIGQVAAVLSPPPKLDLVLGHGSGSFGHSAAAEHGTRDGITPDRSGGGGPEEDYWRGFAEVHHQAAELNRLVMQALHAAGVPALSFPPSAAVLAREGQICSWDIEPIRTSLRRRILPVVYGDVVYDEIRGGAILSTEDLFQYLARKLSPDRILLAGREAGVWQDFPGRKRLLNEINSGSYAAMRSGIGAAVGADVTGGMASKVERMLSLAQELGLSAQIFSGEEPGNLRRALNHEPLGTRITA